MKAKWSFIVVKENHIVLTDATGKETPMRIEMLCSLWEFKQRLVKRHDFGLSWDQMAFFPATPAKEGEKVEEVPDNKFASVWLDEGIAYDIKKRKRLNVHQKADLLGYKHALGKSRLPADVALNSTKDFVIVDYTDHEIDYMFSESVNSWFWLYDLHTMTEIKMLDQSPLRYRYLHNSNGVREQGVENVKFHPEDPYKIVVTYVDLDSNEATIIDLKS